MSAPTNDSTTNPGPAPDPKPIRRRRRARWLAIPVALLAVLIALLYTPPVQRWAFNFGVAQLESRAGLVVRARHVGIAPHALGITLDGVTIASRATPTTPYFTAARVDITAQVAVVRGRPSFKRIRIVDPSLDLTKLASGSGGGSPFRGLGSLQTGDVSIENLSFLVGTPDSTRVAIRGLWLKGRGDLGGRLQLESVSPGTLLLDIAGARLPFDTLNMSLVLDGGRVSVSRLAARSATAWIEGNGHLLFDRGYPLDIEYRASVDLTRAAGWWNRTSTLKGRAALAGRVAGPFLAPTATARVDAAGFGWLTLSPGRLTADALVTGPGIELRAFALDVPEVTASGKGFLSWSHDAPRSTLNATWHASRLRRLGPMVELKATSIPLVAADGTARINWPGFVPDLARLAGTLETRVTSGDPHGDDHGTVSLVGGDTRWRLDWQQWLPGETTARAQAALRINPAHFGESTVDGTLGVTTANAAPAIKRMAALDITMPDVFLTQLEAGRATLTGPLRGSLAMPQWQVTLDAQDAVVAGLHGIGVGGTFDVDPQRLVTSGLSMKAPGSQISMSGAIGLLEARTDVTFDGHVDARWALVPFVPGEWPIGGTSFIKGSWATRDATVDLKLSFESPETTLAGRRVGLARGSIQRGLASLTGAIDVPELGCRFSGTYDLTTARSHAARAECTHADVVPWLALGGVSPTLTDGMRLSIDGTVDASGTFDSLDALQLKIGLDRISGDIRGQAVALAAPTVARWTRGTLDAGSSAISVGNATIAIRPASGTPAASSVTVAATLADILALWPPDLVPPGLVANGALRVEARVPQVNPRDLSAQASVDIIEVTRDAMQVARGVRATARIDRDRVELQTMKGTLLGATVDATADAPSAWIAPWLAPTTAAATASASPQLAHVRGTIEASLAAVVEALSTDASKVTGIARLSVDLTANAPTVDAIRGVIVADEFTVQTLTGTFTQDGVWRVRVGNSLATVEALALVDGTGATRIGVSGHVGLGPDAAMDLRVTGAASMTLVDALVQPRVDGFSDVDVHVGGSFSRPTFDGALTLRDVSALSPTESLVLAGLAGRITFKPGVIESVDLRGQLNGGSVTISGSAAFDSSSSERAMHLTARDVFVEYPLGLRNRISADLVLSGGFDTPTLRGTTTFLTEPYRESLPRMAQLLAAFSQPARGATFESSGRLGSVALDVTMVSSIPLRLDNSLGQIEMLPQLRLVGTIDRPGLLGSVAILDGGTIRLQSRTYSLTDSRMDFDPDDGFVPQLRIAGTTRVGEYTITLQMSGPADAIEISLSSDPPLPERDLQAMLLTGQTPGGGAPSEGSRQFAITALSSDLLGIAGQVLGLDYVRIGNENFELVSSDPRPATRLTISKTVLSRFELIFSDNLDNNTTTWIVSYRPLRDFELRVASRDNLERTFEVRHQFSFGPGGSPAVVVAKPAGEARTVLPQETVDSVVILGEPEQTVMRLRSLLALGPGRLFDYRKWLSDHERIRQFYIDAGYLTARIIPTRTVLEPSDSTKARVTLEYRIARGPATSVVVEGWPADAAFVQRLRMAWAVTTFDQFAAADMARVAREMLIDAGYVLPVVQTVFTGASPGPLLATVNVEAGPRVTSKRLTFEGMSVFGEKDLLAIASTPGTSVGAWRDPAALCLLIADMYAAAGYRSAVVKPGPVRIVGSSAVLPFRIVEGPATRVGAVTIVGVPGQRLVAARTATGLVPDALLPSGEERAARLRLERHLRNLGYRSARVDVEVGTPSPHGLVDLTVSVAEGGLRVIRFVVVDGVHTTHPTLVDGAVQVKPGDPAGQEAIAATQRRLYQLGVFKAADIRIEPLAATAAETANAVVPVKAVVSVVEPRRFQLVYGVEFSNAYGPIFDNVKNAVGLAADVRDRNFLGRGMTVSLGGRYDPNVKSVRGLFTVPSLWSLPIRTNLYVGWRDQKLDAGAAGVVDQVSRSVSVEQRWRPKNWMDLSWGYLASTPRFSAQSTTQASTFASNGILASLNGGIVLDKRDNLLDAKRGWFHSSSFQQGSRALGSDLTYTRYVGQALFFASAGPLVSASAVRFGSLWNMNGNVSLAVIDLRFRTGGSQTVRGYPQDGLTAGAVQGIPVGGTRLLVLNQELRLSVSKRLQGVVFADAGNVFGSEGIALGNLKVGLGLGLRIVTPLAPLRLDFGFPVPRRPGDRAFRWYISVGQVF